VEARRIRVAEQNSGYYPVIVKMNINFDYWHRPIHFYSRYSLFTVTSIQSVLVYRHSSEVTAVACVIFFEFSRELPHEEQIEMDKLDHWAGVYIIHVVLCRTVVGQCSHSSALNVAAVTCTVNGIPLRIVKKRSRFENEKTGPLYNCSTLYC